MRIPTCPPGPRLAVYKEGNIRYVQKVASSGRILVPLERDSEFVRNVRWARGVEPYESVTSLFNQFFLFINQCIDLAPMSSFLLSNFVLSSWVVDRLPVAPYIAVVGLQGSGKSTLLEILRLLCRRSILTADITSAAFYRICNRFSPTLLIDEALTAAPRSKLFSLLKSSFTPGMTAFRKDQTYKAFGAKVVSWIELPNDHALNSRCIVIPLLETKRTDLKRASDPEIRKVAGDLQRKLLQYRLTNLNSLMAPRVAGDERLHGRNRDMYESFARANGDPRNCEKLVKAFEILEKRNREPLRRKHTAVLRVLFLIVHTTECRDLGWMKVGDLSGYVNRWNRSRRQSLQLTAREVGAILTSLGITDHERTRWGYGVRLDRVEIERIHHLVFRYGLDDSWDEPDPCESPSKYRLMISSQAYETCEFCNALENPKREEQEGDEPNQAET